MQTQTQTHDSSPAQEVISPIVCCWSWLLWIVNCMEESLRLKWLFVLGREQTREDQIRAGRESLILPRSQLADDDENYHYPFLWLQLMLQWLSLWSGEMEMVTGWRRKINLIQILQRNRVMLLLLLRELRPRRRRREKLRERVEGSRIRAALKMADIPAFARPKAINSIAPKALV